MWTHGLRILLLMDLRLHMVTRLDSNTTLKDFRKMFYKTSAVVGEAPRSAPPLSGEHTIEHGKHFLDPVDMRDAMLHALLLVAMNSWMWYDEIGKLKIEHLKCTKYAVELGIREKNQKLG